MLENSYPIDLVVPVYNEGKGIKQVLNLLETNVKTRFRVLICYDFEEDTTLEVVKNMPKWKPGKTNGKNENAKFTLPLRFKFTDNEGVSIAPIIGIDIAKNESSNILSFTFSVSCCKSCSSCVCPGVDILSKEYLISLYEDMVKSLFTLNSSSHFL